MILTNTLITCIDCGPRDAARFQPRANGRPNCRCRRCDRIFKRDRARAEADRRGRKPRVEP